MKMEQIECSETSAYKIQTPGNYPEENIQCTMLFLSLYFQKVVWGTVGNMLLSCGLYAC
jgi:hypothetical protein